VVLTFYVFALFGLRTLDFSTGDLDVLYGVEAENSRVTSSNSFVAGSEQIYFKLMFLKNETLCQEDMYETTKQTESERLFDQKQPDNVIACYNTQHTNITSYTNTSVQLFNFQALYIDENTISWDMMPCNPVDSYQGFEGTFCNHLQA
jgi:hypothetical protein